MTKVCVICMTFLYLVLPNVSAAGNLTDNGNGTVTDSGTLLIWQQGENSAMTWEEALTYCEGLTLVGQTDWRLPNIKELSSLVDDMKYNPAINTTLFPNASSLSGLLSYWSSTPRPLELNAMFVDFRSGFSFYEVKTVSHYVRCVRGGQ